MANIYTLGGISFPTKEAVTEHVSAILNAEPIGTEVSGGDALVLFDLLGLRKDKLAEIGGREVVGFERGYRDGKEKWTRCFWAVLDDEDGTKIDVSMQKAIGLLSPNALVH